MPESAPQWKHHPLARKPQHFSGSYAGILPALRFKAFAILRAAGGDYGAQLAERPRRSICKSWPQWCLAPRR